MTRPVGRRTTPATGPSRPRPPALVRGAALTSPSRPPPYLRYAWDLPPRPSAAHTGERGRPSWRDRGHWRPDVLPSSPRGACPQVMGSPALKSPGLRLSSPRPPRRPAGAAAPPPAGRLVPGGRAWAFAPGRPGPLPSPLSPDKSSWAVTDSNREAICSRNLVPEKCRIWGLGPLWAEAFVVAQGLEPRTGGFSIPPPITRGRHRQQPRRTP
jgi:hypothetical protein